LLPLLGFAFSNRNLFASLVATYGSEIEGRQWQRKPCQEKSIRRRELLFEIELDAVDTNPDA